MKEINIKDGKKSTYKNVLKVFLVVGILFIALLGYGFYVLFIDMDRLPTGEYLTEETSPNGEYLTEETSPNGEYLTEETSPNGEYLTEETSPNGKYTIKAYINNGGATVSFAIRGELVFNEKSNKTKNIYWNYREETANITWTDNDTVVINGHSLDVPKGKFDFRNQ